MGDVGRFNFLGFIVSRDSYMNRWEVILSAEEGKLEFSYRWFRTCKDAEGWCVRRIDGPIGEEVSCNSSFLHVA